MASSYVGADGYRYVVYNLMTQKFKILPPSTQDIGHAVSQARLAFDPTTSSHFHVIEYVDVNDLCTGVEIYSSELQHGSIRNLNGAMILM